MDNFVGALISLNCGDECIYQGKVVKVDPTNKNVTISSAFKNGIPLGTGKNVMVSGGDIRQLRVLKTASELSDIQATTALPKSPAVQNTVLCANRANESESPRLPNEPEKRTPRTIKPKMKSRIRHKGDENTPTDETDESSSNEERSYNSARRNQQNKEKKKNFHQPQEEASKELPNVAPTPHFRAFEPQIPCPQQISRNFNKSSRGRIMKPCGIPTLDARNAYGRIQMRNNDLNKPIDFDLLDTDFDFERNFELFRNQVDEDLDERHFEENEQPKKSKNFAHYENIIEDPSRVTSWTKVQRTNKDASPQPTQASTSMENHSSQSEFQASGFISTQNGGRIPFYPTDDKKKLLRRATRFLGTDVFNAITADRLCQFATEIAKRYSFGLSPIIIFGRKSSNPQLVDRLLLYFSNRNLETYVYGCEPSEQLSNVHVIEQVEHLPINCKIAMCIDGESSTDNIIDWFITNKECHIVTLESTRARIPPEKLHCMYLMVPSLMTAPTCVLGRTSFDVLAAAVNGANKSVNWTNSAVADIGTPSGWFSKDCRSALADCFLQKMLLYL